VSSIPVALDTSNRTWEAYGNVYWPKHILIDHNSFIRYEHAGYGTIEEFEKAVVELLEEAGYKPIEDVDSENRNDEIFDMYGMHFHGIAHEICIGYSRLRRFGNNQTMKPNEPNIHLPFWKMDMGTRRSNTLSWR
jgi:hypothetical protein